MNRTRFITLVALSFVVYIAASAGAASARFDLGQVFALLVALALAFTPAFVPRAEAKEGPAKVGVLGVTLSLLLAAWIARGLFALTGELAVALLLPLASLTLLELALSAPDVPPRLTRHARSLSLVRGLAAVGALLGVTAALPPIWLSGRAYIAPSVVAVAPGIFALSAVCLALAVRLARRRFGSDARALAANSWPLIGTCAGACLLALGFVLARRDLALGYVDACTAAAALAVTAGHVWLVSPQRALSAGPLTRAWLATGGALAVTLACALALLPLWPSDPVVRAGGLVLLVLSFAGLRALAIRMVYSTAAPARGRLLDAINQAQSDLPGCTSLDELAARILRPLRRAALLPEAAPLLFTTHPAHEFRLDAAGQPQVSGRALPLSIAQQFDRAGRVPLVRDELAVLLMRRPELREVLHTLDAGQVSVVLPLVAEGQLEGALLVARGARRSALSLEELTQLELLARSLGAMIAVLSARERAHARAQAALQQAEALTTRVDDLTYGLQRTRTQFQTLMAGDATEREGLKLIAYSATMRALQQRLEQVAPHELPVALLTEVGMPIAPLARLVHDASGRATMPFVVMDCAALAPDDAANRLFGASQATNATKGTNGLPGLLELAEDGTLLLCDVPALSLDTQRSLGLALSERRARRVGSEHTYPLRARLLATLRAPLAELVTAGALAPELSRWFEPTSYRVPPLRERAEDLESLIMIAVDRAARVSGRLVPGVTPEALRALVAYTWPGNSDELQSVLMRAVMACRGPRITLADLPPLPLEGAINQGSFVDQEREILRRALERADGNKTRAARALGLKRTTLTEKLKRHALDDSEPDTKH